LRSAPALFAKRSNPQISDPFLHVLIPFSTLRTQHSGLRTERASAA
jgi:hypothetical protein